MLFNVATNIDSKQKQINTPEENNNEKKKKPKKKTTFFFLNLKIRLSILLYTVFFSPVFKILVNWVRAIKLNCVCLGNNNSGTAWPTLILMLFWVPWTIYYKMHLLFLKRCWQFWNRAQNMLILELFWGRRCSTPF